jgi:putative SOS response-associated peptidase YedK
MCYYNGIKVTKAEYDRFMAVEMKFAFLNDGMAIHKGFDFNDYPVIKPIAGTRGTERMMMEWGFLPPYLQNREAVRKFRTGYKDERGWHNGYNCLNATSEELLNKIFKDAGKHRRCLVPSAGFYEWMHVQVVGKSGKLLKTPEKFPYLIEMKAQPEFYMAGVYNPWTDKDTNETVNTFAIVTTTANTLMEQIHNSKKRMPTILPGDLAEAWLYNDLSEQEILDIANYQVASVEMKATPLHKDFLKRENPHEEIIYKEVPELIYS